MAYYFVKYSIVFSPERGAVCSSGTLAGINILIKAYECINYTWEVSKSLFKLRILQTAAPKSEVFLANAKRAVTGLPFLSLGCLYKDVR